MNISSARSPRPTGSATSNPVTSGGGRSIQDRPPSTVCRARTDRWSKTWLRLRLGEADVNARPGNLRTFRTRGSVGLSQLGPYRIGEGMVELVERAQGVPPAVAGDPRLAGGGVGIA